jgi:hypothetical protein
LVRRRRTNASTAVRQPFRRRENQMLDLLFLFVGTAFLVVTAAYAVGCDRL